MPFGTAVTRVVALTETGNSNLPIAVMQTALSDPTYFAISTFALVDDPLNPGQKIEQSATLPFYLSIGDAAAYPPVPPTELRLHVECTASIHGDIPQVLLVVTHSLPSSPAVILVIGIISG